MSGTSTLTFGNLPDLGPGSRWSNRPTTLEITFAVRRINTPEALIQASNRRAQASVSFDTSYRQGGQTYSCGSDSDSTPLDTIQLHEPEPQITKTGWNYDAGQRQGSATNTVYGNNNDDVVWRIRINNPGDADLQDLKFDDLMESGSMVVNYACPTQASADAIAANNGSRPSGSPCEFASNSINDFIVTDPFGQHIDRTYPWGSTYEVDVAAGSSVSVYLVGKVTANGSCIGSRTNRVTGVEWGCEVQSPAGGIGATSTGSVPTATATFVSSYMDGGRPALRVNRQLTGTNTSQPVGTKGTMTITLTNVSGGSITFSDALPYHLRDVLPPEYVVDPTYTPTAAMNPQYAPYAGMVDTIQWTNPAPGTFPINTSDATSYLNNTAPEFRLSSSTNHPIYADQRNMMRHGDVLTITFRVVLIESDYYDRSANLDVTPEVHTAGVDSTDPGYQTPLTNTLTVRFDTYCATQGTQTFTLTGNGTGSGNHTGSAIPAFPEDLDVSIGGEVFILTNDRNQQLPLPVRLTNNGGHDARDYRLFVTFGATMEIVNAPAGCSVTSVGGTPVQPNPWKTWVVSPDPAARIDIPPTATVYACTSPSVIAPGQTVTYTFNVIKSDDPARLQEDDLTFRADVVGEITLSDGTPLWFPAPITRADGETDRANNYSLDTVWARVIGFNLIKNQVGTCTEDNTNPPPVDMINGKSAERVQIGEECTYNIETGGWFGFETPGFAYIAVQNIDVVDEAPDGQAYISSTDPYAASTPLIKNVVLNPAGLTAVTEGWFDWRFNVSNEDRIEQADEWFRVDVTTRILNDAINSRTAPNLHGANTHNILNSTFDATFQNKNTGSTELYTLGPDTVGYPNEPIRRADLTITEPHIEVVKEVCNETMYGTGTACSNWTTLSNEGDTYDSYIYRLTVRNQEIVNGLRSAPAYDVVVTDELDAADLVYVIPFDADGLDNDADGTVDDADEGTISDNTVLNSVPPVLTFSHTHSSGLLRIEPGAQVQLYYRVDPDQRTAPMQQLTNRFAAGYDSLEGSTVKPSGNQTVDLRPNGDIGGAREYESDPAEAVLQIIPLETLPKEILRLSDRTPSGTQPQDAVIGEEIEYRLQADLPVARLRNFRIRDELPAGLSCIEAPVVDLRAAPYDAAGFTRPDGSTVPPVTPSCTADLVEWDFGDVVLTKKPGGVSRFRFPVTFIARVDNVAANQNGTLLSNGHPATLTTLYYIDEAGVSHELEFGQNDVRVTEPVVELTKTITPAGNADAADELTVTITATNTGTATAYNLRLLDDLTDRNMTFIAGTVSGAAPPDTVDPSADNKTPVFTYAPTNPLAPGASYTFTFRVRVDLSAEPLELLDNSIEADWTSLPGQATALNSSGQIGIDGAADGMRIGALPNAGDTLNDYEATASDASVSVPPMTLTKTDLDPAVVPTIGAHKQFELALSLPEGTSRNVRIQDNLNSGGVSYFLTRDANYDVSYSFEGIATINGAPPSEAAFTSFTAVDGASGTIEWNVGEVVTQSENDVGAGGAITPRIVITYYARINNDLVTDQGVTLRNGVTANYSNGETGATESLTANTDAVSAVEPLLTVVKSVDNRMRPITEPAQGGDELVYTLTIENTGLSTAWDVNIVDAMAAGLTLIENPTATINGVAVAGFNPVPGTTADGYNVWGRDNGDNSISIPAGETLTFVYAARIVSASGDLNNTAWVDWTSLDGAITYERTGNGCPNIVDPDDYCVSDTSPVRTIDVTSIDKFFVSDTYATGASTADDAIVRIGDTVTYRLVLNLQGGRTSDVRVEDVLPAGMAFDSIVSINGDATADYSQGGVFSYAPITAAQVPTAGQTGTLVWNIGTVNNSSTQSPFEIVYTAKVMPDAGIAHVASTTLTNTAYLHYTQGNGDPSPTLTEDRLSAAVDVTLLQPIIAEITKTDRGGLTSPANVNIATDTMQFQLQACNATGQAPAYSVQITDDLPPELDIDTLTAPVVSVGGSVLGAAGYTYTAPAADGDAMVFVLNTPVDPGQCVVIDYDVGFNTDIPANSSWNNSATLDEYWSLPARDGQLYGPPGPATFVMQNAASAEPPTKTLSSAGEATIGELVEYQITVPGTPVNAVLHDVLVIDQLGDRLELVSFEDVSGNGFTLTDTSTTPGELRLSVGQIPAGQQAVVRLVTRVANNASTNAGDSIVNTAGYEFRYSVGGDVLHGGDASADPVRIVEPLLAIAKSVENLNNPTDPPKAGDVLRYTVTLTASGGAAGDNFSGAFDISLIDSLSIGLEYVPGSAVVDGGNTIVDPAVTGDGVSQGQTLTWNLAGGTDIDIAEGATVTISYDTVILDGVTPRQVLINSVTAQWTGLDGDSTYERNGTATPDWNDYFTAPASAMLTTIDTTAITKTRLADTYDATDANVRIGDIIDYELRLDLQEGTHNNVVVTDTLPAGMVFEGVASVTRFGAAATLTPTVSGDAATGTTVTFDLGSFVNTADGDASNDYIAIVYRARALNEFHPQVNSLTLTNSATIDYATSAGPTSLSDDETVTVLQPNLSVAKTAATSGGDNVVEAGELVAYSVDIRNDGTAPAYDTVLADTLPAGVRQGGVTMIGISLVDNGTGAVTASLPGLAPSYDPATGVASWNFDTGAADAYTIPAGQTLRVEYRVQVDLDVGAGLALANAAAATLYYSLDNDAVPANGSADYREVYGPTNTAQVTVTTLAPAALRKANTQPTAAVGEHFAYRVTVPAVPVNAALYDVRILDDLTASAADLQFVSVAKIAGTQNWTPQNIGTDTNLIIADPVNGIDIPAGEQAVIEITVVLTDSATNVAGLLFNNTATYSYNQLDGNPASVVESPTHAHTTDDMVIVGPDSMRVEKTGPAVVQVGTPGSFTITADNTGTGPAWGTVVSDQLPEGMCDAAPSNFAARIQLADGTLVAALTQGTDFEAAFAPAPDCMLTFTMTSATAAIGPSQQLVVTYDAALDIDVADGATFTNVAATTQWYSADPNAGPAHAYTGTLSDGTPADPTDEQDLHTITAEAAVVTVQKSVVNATTGQDPGADAQPGETLRYTLYVRNESAVPVTDATFVDHLAPYFAPGTLTLISVPTGADTSQTDPNGGNNGTGLLDVRGMTLAAQGQPGDTLTIVFEATLAPVITSGTQVLNQAELTGANLPPNLSNETSTLIASAPAFQVLKTSQDMTGDLAVLMAGDVLRYTITVKNIGSENAVNAMLRDAIPANTVYVANSTTLNGAPVADPAAGVSPLQAGMPINAPEDATPGAMRADASATTANVATITFDVRINSNVVDGTIISNQGYVGADGEGTSGPIDEQPSDDPDTAAPNDPTRDVVGNLPLIAAHKTVQIWTDNGSAGIADPLDVLRYTIRIENFGAVPATDVRFTDLTPANSTYVPDSVTLNGLPVGQPDGGISPLLGGIPINSPDQPAASAILSPGEYAEVTFDVQINASVPTGTVISNQGHVASAELPTEPTDADGDRSNGHQPTVIVVGLAQQLSITKEVFVVGGGAAEAGKTIEYVVRVTNIGTLPATDVLITDDVMTPPLGDQITYEAGSATLNGSTAGVSFVAPTIVADYSAVYGDLAPSATAELRFRAQINPALPIGTRVTNTAEVQWNSPAQTAVASVSFDVGGMPGSAIVNGGIWHDANFSNVYDDVERKLGGWTVEIYRNGMRIGSVVTDDSGAYSFSGLAPNDTTTDTYEIRFTAAGASLNTAMLGEAFSPFTNGLQRISDIIAGSGANLQNLDLPIDPNGVVYDSIYRTPIAGATLTMVRAATDMTLPTECFDDPLQQGQTTGSDGFYKFDLNFSSPACPPNESYLIQVQAPGGGYTAAPSRIIPPLTSADTDPLSVPLCAGGAEDAVPATPDYCEAQASESAPSTAVPPRTPGTAYYMHLTFSNGFVPAESQLFNNHIPIDPEIDQALTITKTAALVNVSRGQMVPYTITVNNNAGVILYDLSLVDTLPAGFKYVAGSARIDGEKVEPAIDGRVLRWEDLDLEMDSAHKLDLLAIVGAGVTEGNYVNRAQAFDAFTGDAVSGEATATVRVVPDPTFDCTDIIGKVYDDANRNGRQDDGELGIPGVRIVSARGLIITTDEHGRYHVACAVVPDEDRGSNFILKLDDRSLPTGYRLTTENPLVQRTTRGKMIKFNFGATLHRVVSLSLADEVFEPGTSEVRIQWRQRFDLLMAELRKAPSILRLSYLADIEDPALVQKRIDDMTREVERRWEQEECCRQLSIETEIFWRRGAPPERK